MLFSSAEEDDRAGQGPMIRLICSGASMAASGERRRTIAKSKQAMTTTSTSACTSALFGDLSLAVSAVFAIRRFIFKLALYE
jgi:hypothetical protein